jgi:hypothetical protein
MRLTGLLLCLMLLLAFECHASTLKPFTTDGCSLWIDGTPDQPHLWRHCCVAHDLDYWQGGTEEQRLKSDETLKRCVSEAQGKAMADYMYANVRWGGSPYWITSYRWGYGWNYWDGFLQRGYKKPGPEEQTQIDVLIPAARRLVAQDALQHPVAPPKSDTEAASAGSSPQNEKAP